MIARRICLKWLLPLLLAGCVAATTPPEDTTAVTGVERAERVAGRLASHAVPAGCETLRGDRLRQGGAILSRQGCRVEQADGVIAIALTEITLPFDDVFTAPPEFREAAIAFPREVLVTFLVDVEAQALANSGPDWRYTDRRVTTLDGDGGVAGADACLRFTFAASSRDASPTRNRLTGLRCARLDRRSGDIEEVMVEIIGSRPRGAPVPQGFDAIAALAMQSLRYD